MAAYPPARNSKTDIVEMSLPCDRQKSKQIIICIFLAVVTLAVYWQVLDHDFLGYDDDVYVTDNPYVKRNLTRESVVWAFTAHHASNWHPVTWLSHMLDYRNYGSDPRGHHLSNLLFHVANTLLLFAVLNRMTGALWKSAFVAALFALHPLNVDSVAWIAERKNVLSAFFWFLTMWAYLNFIEKRNLGRYCMVIFLFALGLMSKPMLVTLPFALVLLDYWPLGRLRAGQNSSHFKNGNVEVQNDYERTWSQLFLEKVPLFALSMGSSIVTFIAQKSGGAMAPDEAYPLKINIANALISYLDYLKKMFWPQGLSVFYPHPGHALSLWQGAGCGALVLMISVYAALRVRRAPYLAVGWFWYLGTLAPVIGIIQVGGQAMADRYMYIPLIGIFIIIAWGVPDLLKNWPKRDPAMAVSAAIIISVLCALTWKQTGYWKNNLTLFTHAVEVADNDYPRHAFSYNKLGAAYNEQSEYAKAIPHFRKAIQLMPNFAYPHSNLGFALNKQGKIEEATPHFIESVRLMPDSAANQYNLGNFLSGQKKFEEAIPHYRKAIKFKAGYALAHLNLGLAFSKTGKTQKAMAHTREALRINPDLAEAHNNMGLNLEELGSLDEAVAHYREGIRINSEFGQLHENLGAALSKKKHFEESILHLREAIRLDPKYAKPHYTLGTVLSRRGQTKEAVHQYRKAIELRPDYFQAHKNLGIALSLLGNNKESIYHLNEAKKYEGESAAGKTK